MKFGASISALHGVLALALLTMGNNAASAAQATQQDPLERAPQTQEQNTDPSAAPPMAPVTQTPPLSIPPVAAPPMVTPAPPVPTTVAPKPKKKGPVDALKPGDYVWVAQDVYEGPMKIVVVLDIQRVYVFQNDTLIGFSTISSGKKGKETPTGYFKILQKNIDHKSNLYSNAPMPFMQRLTWDGIALHGGHLPGYPASHGCIRLPHAFAKALFGVTQLEQEVFVLKDTATPVKRPEPKPVVDPVTPPPLTPVDSADAPPAPQSTNPTIYPPEPID